LRSPTNTAARSWLKAGSPDDRYIRRTHNSITT
jgi:hypothetical protein